MAIVKIAIVTLAGRFFFTKVPRPRILLRYPSSQYLVHVHLFVAF